MPLETLDPTKLQTAIEDAGASWTAGVTSVSQLSPSAKRLILGATFPANYSASLQGQAGAAAGTYPAAFDLTNVSGSNYITPVRNQGGVRFLRSVRHNRNGRRHLPMAAPEPQHRHRFVRGSTFLL
jgi:hypothetical protein